MANAMTGLQQVAAFVADNVWSIIGLSFTAIYVVVLILMTKKVVRDRRSPQDQNPKPKPLFYLGQLYLGFIWPVPLFLILEALDILSVAR